MIHTEKEAASKICPMNISEMELCLGSACMWWDEVHPRMERKDHSGARACMSNTRMELHKAHGGKLADIKREGPPGSLGIWVIEARGRCGGVR